MAAASRGPLATAASAFVPWYPRSLMELMGQSFILVLGGGLQRRVHGLAGALFKSQVTADMQRRVGRAMDAWTTSRGSNGGAAPAAVRVQDETNKVRDASTASSRLLLRLACARASSVAAFSPPRAAAAPAPPPSPPLPLPRSSRRPGLRWASPAPPAGSAAVASAGDTAAPASAAHPRPGLLLRAQDVARAAGRRGGRAGGGHRGRAAADDGLPRGREHRHGVTRQHHRAVGAGHQAVRRRPPRRRVGGGGGGGTSGLARVDATPGRARGVRAVDEQQRRVRGAVRRAGGVRARVPRPRTAAGEGRRRALHPALHHLVLPRRVPGHAAVQGAVHQPRPLLRAGPRRRPGRRLRRQGRGGGEPPAGRRRQRRAPDGNITTRGICASIAMDDGNHTF